MHTSDHPPYRPAVGAFLLGLLGYQWVAAILKGWGYVPYRSPGLFIGLALFIGFALSALLVDFLLARILPQQALRSALWFSAVLGPYAGLLAFSTWGEPIASHIVGIVTTLLAFGLGYFLEKRFKPA